MNYDDHLKEWDDRRAVMAKLRRQGVTVRGIATRYGISTQRIYQILKNGQKQATVAISKDKQNVGKYYTGNRRKKAC